jgi:hypothetical protein
MCLRVFDRLSFDELLSRGLIKSVFPVKMNFLANGDKDPTYYGNWKDYTGNMIRDTIVTEKSVASVTFCGKSNDLLLVCLDVDNPVDSDRIKSSGVGRVGTAGSVSISGKLHVWLLLEKYDGFNNIRFLNTYDDNKMSFEIFNTESVRHMYEKFPFFPDEKLWDNIDINTPFCGVDFEGLLCELGIRFRYDKNESIVSNLRDVNFDFRGDNNRDLRVLLNLVPDRNNLVLCPFHSEERPSALISGNGEILTDMHDDESYCCSRDGSALIRISTKEVVKNFNGDEVVMVGVSRRGNGKVVSGIIDRIKCVGCDSANPLLDELLGLDDDEGFSILKSLSDDELLVFLRKVSVKSSLWLYYKLVHNIRVPENVKLAFYLEDVLLVRKNNNKLYYYNGELNLYDEIFDLGAYIDKVLNLKLNNTVIPNIAENIRLFKDKDYSIIRFNNCLYSTVQCKFFPLGVFDDAVLPYLTIQHDIDFDGVNQPIVRPVPIFEDGFIDKVTYTDFDGVDFVRGVYQTIGLLMLAGNPYKLLYFIIGVADSGKSLFVNLLQKIFGIYNMGKTSFPALGEFDESSLIGKKVGFVTEMDYKLSFRTVADVQTLLKERVGQDDIQVKRKNLSAVYVDKLDVYNLVLAGNELPFKEIQQSLIPKMYWVPFNKGVPEKEQDPNFISLLIPVISQIIVNSLDSIVDVNIKSDLEFYFPKNKLDIIMEAQLDPAIVVLGDMDFVMLDDYSTGDEDESDSLFERGLDVHPTKTIYEWIEEYAHIKHVEIKKWNRGYKHYIADILGIETKDIRLTTNIDGERIFKNVWCKKPF